MERNKPWTEEEDRFLIENYHLTAKQAAEKLGRTIPSINGRKGFLRKRVEIKPRVNPWSVQEIEFIKNNISSMSKKEMAESLGRRVNEIDTQIRKLRKSGSAAYKLSRWTEKDKQFLRDNRKNMTCEEMSKILNRSRETISAMCLKLGLMKHKHIEKNNIYKRLRGSWNSMKARCLNPNVKEFIGAEICEEWMIFENFYDWAVENYDGKGKLTRIDRTKGFYPENCKFSEKVCVDEQKRRKNMKKTCLDRYGVENPFGNEAVKSKLKKTCIDKYGVDNPLKNKRVRDKIKKTCLSRYGVDNPIKSDTVRNKMQNTCLIRYGVKAPFQSKEIREKAIASLLEKYDDGHFLKTPSSEEISLKNHLESFGYKFESTWDLLGSHQIDLYNKELKLAFEYNGLWYHSEFYKKDKFYHYNKYVKCKKSGVCLIHIWQDHWKKDKEYIEQIVKFLFGQGEHPDVDKYENCIPNGLGLELTEKFKSKKFIGYKDPEFFLISKNNGNYRIDSDNLEDCYKIWDAGYSLYK